MASSLGALPGGGAGCVLDCRARYFEQSGSRVLSTFSGKRFFSSLLWRRGCFDRRSACAVLVRADKRGSNAAEATGDKWMKLLPDKKSALYSHSLPCIEAWLRSLGFSQSAEERASWVIQRADWHAHLSLEMTELRIRYLKGGPGNLERDVERKFSYALCREDLENAILGGP